MPMLINFCLLDMILQMTKILKGKVKGDCIEIFKGPTGKF